MVFLQSAPHPALRNYIAQYLYVVQNSFEMGSARQTFLPYNFPALSFFFDKIGVNQYKNIPLRELSVVYSGLITSPLNLSFTENKDIRAFIVALKPFGFSDLFNLDISEATDQAPDFFAIKYKDARILYEQLEEEDNFSAQVKIADNYFLRKIPRHDNTAQIRAACRQIIERKGIVNIKQLAYDTNLSLSTLERKFTQKVGVTPKMFTRFKRFHHALSLISSPNSKSLTDISQYCGYYDQAHFIKEFQAFTLHKPSSFSLNDYALFNQFILHRNYDVF